MFAECFVISGWYKITRRWDADCVSEVSSWILTVTRFRLTSSVESAASVKRYFEGGMVGVPASWAATFDNGCNIIYNPHLIDLFGAL